MRNKNIVTIGGGTGSFMLLSGLKKYPINISAILSMADDGGSTGKLRDELGVLPPGDVRQCLVALSDSSKNLRTLMNYRFEGGALRGHSFGNLFLSALEKISGGFDSAVEEAGRILNVKGEVIPVTQEDMRLFIQLKNGKVINGETELDHNKDIQMTGLSKIYLKPKVKANKKAIERISKADLIVIGPGDLYGSIIPNLLVTGIAKAICRSKAKVVYNCNLTNKKGQTVGFDLDQYAEVINHYLGAQRLDYVIFNTEKPSVALIKKYERREGKSMIVKFGRKKAPLRSYRVVKARLLNKSAIKEDKSDLLGETRSFIRHDSDRLAKVLMMIAEIGDYENIIKEII